MVGSYPQNNLRLSSSVVLPSQTCSVCYFVLGFFFYVLFLSHKTDLMGQTQRATSLTLKLDHLQNFRDRTISIELYFLKGMTQTTSIGRKYFIERRQPWSLV